MVRGGSSCVRLGVLLALIAIVSGTGLEGDKKKWQPGYVSSTLADAYADVIRMKAEALNNKHEQAQATEIRSLPTGTLPATKSKDFAYTNIRLQSTGTLGDEENRIGDLLAATTQGAPVSGVRDVAVSGARTAEVPQLPAFPEFNLPKLPKLDLNPFDNHKEKKEGKKEGLLGLFGLGAGLGGGVNDDTAPREAAIATAVPPVNPFVAGQAGTLPPPPVVVPAAAAVVPTTTTATVANVSTAPLVNTSVAPTPKPSSLSNLSPSLIARVGAVGQPAAEPIGAAAAAAAKPSEDLLQF